MTQTENFLTVAFGTVITFVTKDAVEVVSLFTGIATFVYTLLLIFKLSLSIWEKFKKS